MAGRACSSPNHHLPAKRRKLPLFWLPNHQGQHQRQPSPHQADDPNLEPLLPTPLHLLHPVFPHKPNISDPFPRMLLPLQTSLPCHCRPSKNPASGSFAPSMTQEKRISQAPVGTEGKNTPHSLGFYHPGESSTTPRRKKPGSSAFAEHRRRLQEGLFHGGFEHTASPSQPS